MVATCDICDKPAYNTITIFGVRKLKQSGKTKACVVIDEPYFALTDNSQLPGDIGCPHMEYVCVDNSSKQKEIDRKYGGA